MGCCHGKPKYLKEAAKPKRRVSFQLQHKQTVVEKGPEEQPVLMREPNRSDGSREQENVSELRGSAVVLSQVRRTTSVDRQPILQTFAPRTIAVAQPSDVQLAFPPSLHEEHVQHIAMPTAAAHLAPVAQPQPPEASEDLLQVINDDKPKEAAPANRKPSRFPLSRPQRIQIPTFDYGNTH